MNKIDRFVGIDGEGIGRKPHRYTYLALVAEDGETLADARDENLSTQACLEAILSTPVSFGFALTYDITMWLRDLPAKLVYMLSRPDLRRVDESIAPSPIDWYPSNKAKHVREPGEIGYRMNYTRGRFEVRRIMHGFAGSVEIGADYASGRYNPSTPVSVVWDIFRFFGKSFVGSLKDWEVGTPGQVARIAEMKEQRSNFEHVETSAIEGYCREECVLMAQLTRKLLTAHADAGLALNVFFGPGSTAAVILNNLKIKRYSRQPMPEMMRAVACAFIGGRFEISQAGPVRQHLYSYDICSAYPFVMTSLPCLTHGTWYEEKRPAMLQRAIEESQLACVHARSNDSSQDRAWGSLPWRSKDGEIVYPAKNPGTWVWRNEYLAARRISNVTADRAWLYNTKCKCTPFAEFAEYYRLRKLWGAEGRGMALKLGINSGYGKLAQSRGSATYNNWIWAGVITSNTRAMLLDALARVRAPSDILMMATDGIVSKTPIEFDAPKVKDELGSWKPEEYKEGLMLIRPGIYFPLAEHTMKSVRSRGVHRKTLRASEEDVLRMWEKHGPRSLQFKGVDRFVGMLTGIYATPDGLIRRRSTYGDWVPIDTELSYDPKPKRSGFRDDYSLRMVDSVEGESSPYMRAISEQLPDARARMLCDLIREENY